MERSHKIAVLDRALELLSLRQHVIQQHEMEVASFNDTPSTSFRSIRNLVKNYIATLKGEQS